MGLLDDFSAVSAYSLAGVMSALLLGWYGARRLLASTATKADRFTFIWCAFDALIHTFYEGSFLYNSTFGRTADSGTSLFCKMWQEYAKADTRWGTADPTVVSLEILTVLIMGPICLLICYQIARTNPMRHFWLIVLSTSELYGGFMTFAPEWLQGSPSLYGDTFLKLWVYLALMNLIWVFIPLWLLYESYLQLSQSLGASTQSTRVQTRSVSRAQKRK
ncbi:uncharacterized protein L969DRAFT_93879 [Mixia osmundae IAM 14324]|uniref:EXPERA domain-containing protein n=1 Tax=Mixia osmundae (strain CBS 9802 / IAM 14324 / JCM 22182 / KY 12970) TaxID=764103 RepID=G7E9U8_MIXOS|nr:uncharacterized protein L969DRAFT_93879 [Mixia osmundae IAM 14324]KEI40050.1 hypothetical protein L969DRAFT_93879 [Mixia osmundae IAM 14324]GAA99417.1 hypothetical protein E5Q_06115 [Mixia osmundae IAM 14324]